MVHSVLNMSMKAMVTMANGNESEIETNSIETKYEQVTRVNKVSNNLVVSMAADVIEFMLVCPRQLNVYARVTDMAKCH